MQKEIDDLKFERTRQDELLQRKKVENAVIIEALESETKAIISRKQTLEKDLEDVELVLEKEKEKVAQIREDVRAQKRYHDVIVGKANELVEQNELQARNLDELLVDFNTYSEQKRQVVSEAEEVKQQLVEAQECISSLDKTKQKLEVSIQELEDKREEQENLIAEDLEKSKIVQQETETKLSKITEELELREGDCSRHEAWIKDAREKLQLTKRELEQIHQKPLNHINI